jgi:hypothetical protein
MNQCRYEPSRNLKPRVETRSLIANQHGLSTMEYAVLFIVIIVGTLALWSKLSKSLAVQVDGGTQTFNSTLDAARERGRDGQNGGVPPSGTGSGSVLPAQPSQPAAPAPSAPATGPGTKKQNSI